MSLGRRHKRWTEAELRRMNVAVIGPKKAPKPPRDPRIFGGFCFRVPWPPSWNNATANTERGRIKSRAAKAYVRNVLAALIEQNVPRNRISHPLSITMRQHANNSRSDCANFEKLLVDSLVRHNVLAEDNRTIVKQIHIYDCERSETPFIEVSIAAVSAN